MVVLYIQIFPVQSLVIRHLILVEICVVCVVNETLVILKGLFRPHELGEETQTVLWNPHVRVQERLGMGLVFEHFASSLVCRLEISIYLL